MNYAQRIPMTLRVCSRACNVALASLFVALSTCGASSSSSPGLSEASAVESAAPDADGGLPCRS